MDLGRCGLRPAQSSDVPPRRWKSAACPAPSRASHRPTAARYQAYTVNGAILDHVYWKNAQVSPHVAPPAPLESPHIPRRYGTYSHARTATNREVRGMET
ncbi:hypothetical protein PMIN01_12946 [Paraphaeosphaeria minitans]|uniref:Uncharacterized protein n=1 Tax=Paraphaeosphaeria minitans TaxID=565426 RepID=A0A9P6G607_9PLEO|nr:hypothetical protein PMIN01_12946 [Paraphaeosphaeria minitans]